MSGNVNQNNENSNNTIVDSYNTFTTQAPMYFGVFYAYLKITPFYTDPNEPAAHTHEPAAPTHEPAAPTLEPAAHLIHPKNDLKILVFPSRNDVDRWWRSFSMLQGIHRINPQFYCTDDLNIIRNIRNNPHIHMVDAITSSRFTMITPHRVVDHLSGSEFGIRSVAHPTLHWFFDSGSPVGSPPTVGSIIASETRRTTFRVEAIGVGPGTVMIDVDLVTLRLPDRRFISRRVVSASQLPQQPASTAATQAGNSTTPDTTSGATQDMEGTASSPRFILTAVQSDSPTESEIFSFAEVKTLHCHHSGHDALIGAFTGIADTVSEEWEITVY